MRLHVGTALADPPHDRKLEEDLDPKLFIRVHRSVILRRDTITGLYRDEAGPGPRALPTAASSASAAPRSTM